MNKSSRKANPDFFNQQNNDVQVFVKPPTTGNVVSSSSKIQQLASRPATSIQPEETKPLSLRQVANKTKQTSRKEPIPPQEESLYEMTRYLNKQQTREFNNDDSFQYDESESQLFKPARHNTLRMDDLEDSLNESDKDEKDNSMSPQSIDESPIKKHLPSHRRSLSARMLPNMGRGFVSRREESEEDSPIKEQLREEIVPKRKAPRYPPSLLNNPDHFIDENNLKNLNIQLRKCQEEVIFLRKEKVDQTKNHNEKVRSLQERHTEELQNQQKRFETILENKESSIIELQRENERLREQLGFVDKSKDGHDTNKLLNDLDTKRKTITVMENEKMVLTDQIEKMKYQMEELTRQLKDSELKIRNKEETLNGLSNKIESQEREIKNLKEREFKEINEREKALAMYTESEKTNQQLQDKLKNLEFQSKQIQRENEILSQRFNAIETNKIQLEKTNDQLRAKVQIMEEELNHVSQEQAIFHQDREQLQQNKQRSQQELENCRKEIHHLRETINLLKSDKSTPPNSYTTKVGNETTSYSNNEIDNNTPNYNYYQNLNYNRKNTNIPLSSFSTHGVIGNETNSFSSGHSTINSNSRETNFDFSTRDQNSQRQPVSQNTRYQQQEIYKEPVIDTPKQSATTAKVMSIINRESPKERQYNRNKIMGTSYSLTPFALDDNASNLQTANIDEQLMQLSLEKTRLEGDMQKLFSMGIKSIAAKKQKMSLELRLEEIEKQSSQLKMRLRNMHY